MKKIILAFFILTALSIASCFDHEFKHESIHKGEILKYLSTLKTIDPDQIQQIDELESKLDFHDVEVYDLKTTEKLIIAHVKSLAAFKDADEIKAIFYINQNEIVRSNIVTFHDATTPSNYDEVIISMVDRREKTYSGKISFHSAFQSLFLFSELENGRLIENGIARPKKSDRGGRTEGCTDWYLVSTTYYASGATRTTEQYLYTSCDCEANETRLGRAACGGGTPGGNGPTTLSPNAPHGSEVEYVDKNGKYILYRYNAYISTWEIVLITLPLIEFESDPYTYPDLAAIHYPIHGMVIFGNNMTFTYDANSGKWFGVLCISNLLKNPCLKKVAEKVMYPKTVATFNALIQKLFNSSDEVTWTINEGTVSGGATTDMVGDSQNNILTILDPSKLVNFSQEFIASTMYHEAFHAILLHYHARNLTPDEHHEAMMTQFLEELAIALKGSFPNLEMYEAKGLILKQALAVDNPVFRSDILKKLELTEKQISDIALKFATNATGTTPCN